MEEAKLFKMLETLALISATTDLDRLLRVIMKAIKEVMESEASSLMLLDAETNELYFSTVEGGSEKVKEIRIKADQGVAGHVCQTGKPMIVNDTSKSPFFLKTVDKKTEFKTRQIICVPLISQKKTVGVLQALNRISRKDFDDDDIRLFTAFSHQVSIAIENAQLYNLSVYDGLTKIFMRRFFEAWMAKEFSRVKRYRTNLAVIMFDIDHFKKINDTHGHQAGDLVLTEIAGLVKAGVRNADILARYGGEEFIIGLPETDEANAKNLADRLRTAVEKHEFVFEGTRIPVTISVGVTSFQKTPEEKVEGFIKDADTALYRSKESGRNCVSIFEMSSRGPKGRSDLSRTTGGK